MNNSWAVNYLISVVAGNRVSFRKEIKRINGEKKIKCSDNSVPFSKRFRIIKRDPERNRATAASIHYKKSTKRIVKKKNWKNLTIIMHHNRSPVYFGNWQPRTVVNPVFTVHGCSIYRTTINTCSIYRQYWRLWTIMPIFFFLVEFSCGLFVTGEILSRMFNV